MNKLVSGLILTILLLTSCAVRRKIEVLSTTNKYVTYDKVKIKVNSQKLGKVTLKGYISIVRDSSICFKFWGPLGIEVISGRLEQKFVLKDHFNDIFYDDALQELIKKTGIVFSKQCVENVLLADVDSLKLKLMALNKGVISITDNQRRIVRELGIENIPRKNMMQFLFGSKSLSPNLVSINYNDESDHWSLEIQILNVSSQQKKCNFGF